MIRFTYGRRYRITYIPDDAKKGETKTTETNHTGSPYPGVLEFANRSKTDLQLWREQIVEAEDIGEAIWK